MSLKKFTAASLRLVLIQGFPTHHFPGQFFFFCFVEKRPGGHPGQDLGAPPPKKKKKQPGEGCFEERETQTL
jgi:hypothetical protein